MILRVVAWTHFREGFATQYDRIDEARQQNILDQLTFGEPSIRVEVDQPFVGPRDVTD